MPPLNRMAKSFLGSRKLGTALASLTLKCLDIGAREGITRDLRPLAPAVAAFGFEPDPEECARLNRLAAANPAPWRSLKFLPVALGGGHGARTLNLYRMRGGSSLFEANLALLEQFDRAGNFQLEGTVPLQTMPLDAAAEQFEFADARFLKLDIQGAELEVLQSAPRLLAEAVIALRVEVEFLPIYKGQPLQHEVDTFLRARGFVPMGIVEPRHWRRTVRRRFSFAGGSRPFSRGQLAHADFIYFRDPQTINEETPGGMQRLLAAGFLALNYQCVDHAAAILTRAAVRRHLKETWGVEVERELAVVSRALARRHLWRQCLAAGQIFGETAVLALGSLVGRAPNVLGPWRNR